MRILVTGSAGFIGFHVAQRLLAHGHDVAGLDGMTPYYDVALKHDRHAVLSASPRFTAHRVMLENAEAVERVGEEAAPEIVIHLAAQAGVRYSIENPRAYIDANLIGSFNIVELCRRVKPAHFLMASTSSAYGANTRYPFRETDQADHPLTLYAATKKSTEAIAHSYAHLWAIPTTVFRFFTVYGPWGRPDMALFKFVRAMLADEAIDVYNHGRMSRDFTYIDDLVEGIVRLVPKAPEIGRPVGAIDTLSPAAPWRVVNIGGGQSVTLMDFITEIEKAVGRPAKRNYLEMQAGDVPDTSASLDLLDMLVGPRQRTPVSTGVGEFVRWYKDRYAG